jgi:hypothetical protein
MQQSSIESAGASMVAPALVAAAIVTAFFAYHYRT